MSSQRPVYRYAPRSHAWNCPCPRCTQVRSRRSGSDGLIAFDVGCLGVVLFFAAVSAVCGWAARNSHLLLSVLPGAGAAALIIAAVVYLNRREDRRTVRPPKGRLRVEATVPPAMPPAGPLPRPKRLPSSPPVMPQPPLCQHVNAEPVDLSTGERVAWVCPDCKTGLPAGFIPPRRSCCGTFPGTRHVYNCPRA